MLRRKLKPILDLHAPGLVVVRKRRANPEIEKALMPVMQALREEVVSRSIGMRFVTAETVKQFFAARGCRNKHQIATVIAEWYPELAWRLPPKRKPWQSEPHSAALFDAAAAGVGLRGEMNGISEHG